MSTSPSRKRANKDDGSLSPPPSKRTLKQASTTTKQAVASFFTPVSQKAKIPEKVSWRTIDSSLIVGQYNAPDMRPAQSGKRKVVAFDFDSTLIGTISKAKFSRDANDWCWWHGTVPAKLNALHSEGYTIVIVSNQNGISLRPPKNGPKVMKETRYNQFKQKITAVFNALNLPITVYAATEKDRFRKPSIGMWEQFLTDQNLKHEDIDIEHSLFVGDAGGRLAGNFNGKLVKADFSCSDRNFAENVGVEFKTPEEYFLSEAPREFTRIFTPSAYLNNGEPIPLGKSAAKEIVLFVGFPGSGKSTFFRKTLEPLGYLRVNQDILKSRDKCIKSAAEYLSEGKSVAVDNTNPDQEVRKIWIEFAKKHNVPIRCVHFTASKELARHNAAVRSRSGQTEMNPEARGNLPDLAFNLYGSRYQEPKLDEGFVEIISIDFSFAGSDEERAIWSKYWH